MNSNDTTTNITDTTTDIIDTETYIYVTAINNIDTVMSINVTETNSNCSVNGNKKIQTHFISFSISNTKTATLPN
jgi:hypothetical protein